MYVCEWECMFVSGRPAVSCMVLVAKSVALLWAALTLVEELKTHKTVKGMGWVLGAI